MRLGVCRNANIWKKVEERWKWNKVLPPPESPLYKGISEDLVEVEEKSVKIFWNWSFYPNVVMDETCQMLSYMHHTALHVNADYWNSLAPKESLEAAWFVQMPDVFTLKSKKLREYLFFQSKICNFAECYLILSENG